MRHRSRNRVRRRALLAISAVAIVGAVGPALSFCDLVFKDVAEYAPIVVLAEYHQPKENDPYLEVLEVLKGETETRRLRLGEEGLRIYKPREGDQFLLALDLDRRLVHTVAGMGACSAKSVLAIRKGKVRSIDRPNWDGTGRAPSLDQLRVELTASR